MLGVINKQKMKNKILLIFILVTSIISVKAQQTTTKKIEHPKYGKAILETYFDQYNNPKQKVIYTKDTLLTNGDKEVGEIILYYTNGTVSAKGNFSTSNKSSYFGSSRKRQGKWLYYDKQGNLEKTLFYKEDKIDSLYTTYHANGNVSSITNYVDGKINGNSKTYFTNKKLHSVLQCKNGKIYNVLEFYNNKGTQIKYGTLKESNGTLDIYDLETGKISKTYTYEDGIPHNIETKDIPSTKGTINQKTYKTNNGKIIKVVRTLNNQLEGLQEKFDYKGILKDANYFSDGKKHGTHTRYNDDGTIFWQDTYVNNNKTGPFIHTAEDSEAEGNRYSGKKNDNVVLHSGFYDEDEKITGRFTSYTQKDSIVIATGQYNKNYKTGVWKFYNEKEELINEVKYGND